MIIALVSLVAIFITIIKTISSAIAVVTAIVLTIFGAATLSLNPLEIRVMLLALVLLLCSFFISWRAMQNYIIYAFIYKIAIAITTLRGTSFRGANLTNANFTSANLKTTDFRQATLTGTCFHHVRKLDLVRPGISYLRIKQLRQLIVSNEMTDKKFDGQDLHGINLKGANLAGASFIRTNLSNANLQEANLSEATLVQAQMDGADFTGATLTGTVIQDWNITTTTEFDQMKCEYD
jgi:uncharacterized protein YjbI with pentapeptide repeats